jgi:hypothetical protein
VGAVEQLIAMLKAGKLGAAQRIAGADGFATVQLIAHSKHGLGVKGDAEERTMTAAHRKSKPGDDQQPSVEVVLKMAAFRFLKEFYKGIFFGKKTKFSW